MLATLQRLTAFAALGLVGLPHASVLADPPTQPALRLEPALHPTEDVHGCVVMQYPDGHEVKVVGPDAGDLFGYAGCFINDIDGDGRWDAAITAPLAGKTTDLIGRVYLVASSDGRLLAEIAGEPGMRFGLDVALTIDSTGDWVDDLLVATSTPERLLASRYLNDHIQRTLLGQLPVTEWVYVNGASHAIFDRGCLERLMRDYLLGQPVTVNQPPSTIRVGDASDLDASGQIDHTDLQRLLNVLASGGDSGDLARIARGAGPLGDINGDGLTTVDDLSGLLSEFGEWANDPATPPSFPTDCCVPGTGVAGYTTWCTLIRFIIDGVEGFDHAPCDPSEPPIDPQPSPPCCPPGVRPPGGGTSPGGSPPGGSPGSPCQPGQPRFGARADINNDGQLTTADELGEDGPVGLVVTTNTHDADSDGLLDLVDGFNRFGDTSTIDDNSSEAHSYPVRIWFCGDQQDPLVTVTFQYLLSDPLEAGAGGPLTPSQAGRLRLWTKPTSVARDPRSVADGGDLIMPGVYSPTDLGLSPLGGTTVVHVEAVNPAASIGEDYLSITGGTLDQHPTAPRHEDTIVITSTQIIVEGRGLEEVEWQRTHTLSPTPLPSSEVPSGTLLAVTQPFQVHRVTIKDPRADLASIQIAGSSLPLVDTGSDYTSVEFIVADPAWTMLPQLAGVVTLLIEPGSVILSYNPKIEVVADPKLKPLAAHLQQYAELVAQEVNSMKAANWSPPGFNPQQHANSNQFDGAFGTELHRRVAASLTGPEWLAEVYAREQPDGRYLIMAIGGRPAGVASSPADVIPDAVRLRPGVVWQVGMVVNPAADVVDVIDIKTSADGSMSEGQRAKLVRFNGGRDIVVTNPCYRWKAATGWSEVDSFKIRMKAIAKHMKTGRALGVAGAGVSVAVSAWAIINYSAHDVQFDTEVAPKARQLIQRIQEGASEVEVFGQLVQFQAALSAYLRHFVPSDEAVGTIDVMVLYGWLYASAQE